MCEYCGCRDNPEIGKLGAEHDAIVDLADQVLGEVKDGSETVEGAIRRLRDLLDPHVRGEEAGIFQVAETLGLGSQYVDELEDDHRRFESLLSDPALAVDALESVLDEIYRHIAVEEYDLFPEVARNLTARLRREPLLAGATDPAPTDL